MDDTRYFDIESKSTQLVNKMKIMITESMINKRDNSRFRSSIKFRNQNQSFVKISSTTDNALSKKYNYVSSAAPKKKKKRFVSNFSTPLLPFPCLRERRKDKGAKSGKIAWRTSQGLDPTSQLAGFRARFHGWHQV